MTVTSTSGTARTFSASLRTLYFIRFAFAIVWAVVLFLAGGSGGALLTVLLVVYPLVDAAAVLWQVRSEGASQASRVPEWINVAVSVIAAIALGLVSTVSISSVFLVWGLWAVLAGAVQLITALLRRSLGGQIPQIVSGAISVLAGIVFAATSAHAASPTGIGGYAAFGGILFLVSAIRLSVLMRRAS
jgi:uncharacterized membrane protein HdeD (DUF308 family)